MSEKLEVEIIDSGDGSASALSPDDFASVREFNKALARMKAAARAKEFEENQEIKGRRQLLKDQKMTFDEEKSVKKKEIEQTRLAVQEMKAKRQLDVVIRQQQRAREADINKQDRHREMMLRHVLGAINPNSTFQYRMSSIYGLLNTAGITSQRDVSRVPGEGEGVQQRVGGILQSLSDGLKTLFGQTGSFFRGAQAKSMASQVITTSPATTAAAGMAKETITSVSPPEEEMPWWWGYKPKGFKPTERDRLKSISQMISGEYKPLGIRSNAPALQPANIKMAIPVQPGAAGGIGGGGFPPVGGSPAGAAGGGAGGGGGLFASGLRFVSNNLMSIGIVAGVASLAFGGLAIASRMLTNRFNDAIDSVRNWSGALIASGVSTQMRKMQFNIERAEKFGETLASFEQSQTSLDIAMTKLGDSLTMSFSPLLSGINNLLSAVATDIASGIDFIAKMAGSSIFNITTENYDKLLNFLYNIGSPLYDLLKHFKKNNLPSNANSIAASLANFLNAPPAVLGNNFDPATMKPVAYSFNF